MFRFHDVTGVPRLCSVVAAASEHFVQVKIVRKNME